MTISQSQKRTSFPQSQETPAQSQETPVQSQETPAQSQSTTQLQDMLSYSFGRSPLAALTLFDDIGVIEEVIAAEDTDIIELP